MYLMRTLCDVLEEMRQCVKTLNFSYLTSLIEEGQSMGNRMEAKLETMKEYESLLKEIKRLEKIRDKLREESE